MQSRAFVLSQFKALYCASNLFSSALQPSERYIPGFLYLFISEFNRLPCRATLRFLKLLKMNGSSDRENSLLQVEQLHIQVLVYWMCLCFYLFSLPVLDMSLILMLPKMLWALKVIKFLQFMFSGRVYTICVFPTNSVYFLQECSTQIPVHCHESQEYRYFIMLSFFVIV